MNFQRVFRSVTGAILLGLTLASATATLAETARPSVESFFQNPAFSEMALSPDGRFAGILVASSGGRVQVAVMDLASMTPKAVSGFSDADIGEFHWVNNDRLVFSMTDRQVATGDIRYYPGLFAVNRDGSNMRTLVDRSPYAQFTTGTAITSKVLPGDTYFADIDRANTSDDVFVTEAVRSNVFDLKALNLLRLNTKTGRTTEFERPGNSVDWIIDQTGTPRVTMTFEDGRNAVYYRDPANERWRKIAEFDAFNGEGFKPYSFGPDGTFYVLARNGKDTEALYRYDLIKNAMDSEPMVATAGYDFRGALVMDGNKKKVIGVNYETDASASLWFDDSVKKIQKSVDDLLPGTINRLSFGRNSQTTNVLVHAFSDVQPGMYLIYDTATNKLTLVGRAQPGVDPKKMALSDMIHYKARDGLDIPAYLSLPPGKDKKNLPMVVLVHGGPWLRGSSWNWDAQVQFLASRGYVVLQPEFRGSTGFGFKHYSAGWKQWGLAMQDDIADGAQWAISQGIADPKRICIAGASYGGYASLMGLANNPELFRCGVEWVGVTDINLMFKSSWENDASAEWQRYGMPILVGDETSDAAQLKATSPVNIAERIRQPLLMAYGGSDRRVPIRHGESFRDAVMPHNPDVEWIDYPEEGHGWALVKNRVDFWTRVESFLEKNIGKGAPSR